MITIERTAEMNDKAITITIPGEPVGKARPRVTKFGTYTPEKTVIYETLVKEMFAIKYPRHKPYEGPVKMKIKAWFTIPKSASKKKAAEMAAGTIRPTKKPDTDNIQKSIADALNGFAYKDDCQIVESEIEKWYSGGQVGVDVHVTEI